MAVKHKFNEDVILTRLKHYIDSTYTEHYGQGKIQTTEVTFDSGHGEGFCIGNILKYAQIVVAEAHFCVKTSFSRS